MESAWKTKKSITASEGCPKSLLGFSITIEEGQRDKLELDAKERGAPLLSSQIEM